MEGELKSTTGNTKSKRFPVSSSSSSSEDEVDKEDIKGKQKKRKGLAEKFQELKPKPKKKEKYKVNDSAMDSLTDIESQPKPPKRHVGVIARIKRFGSRDELDNINEDKAMPKTKEKKKSVDSDSDVVKHLHKEDSKISLLEKLRRFSEDSSSDEEDFATEALSTVNRHRRNHGLRRLRANKELQSLAHEYSRKLGKEQNVLERYSHKYGKNTFSKELSHPDEKLKPEEVVDEWYQEINHYTFGENPQDPDVTKNATQLLWKSSKEVGISKCRARDKNIIFVVAYFSPLGNIHGQYKDQVPPLGGFESKRSRSHSTSGSSSSDDEAKLKEKQDILYGKSTKKNFLSHMFDKFRKNSDGDMDHKDHKKKEKKEHHGFIGHRSGKYFINTGKEQPIKEKEKEKEKEETEKTKEQTKSNFYVATTKELEDTKRNLRKPDPSSEHDQIVFDSRDLDLNKNEPVDMVLAKKESSKMSSSSSSEDNDADPDKNRVKKEKPDSHSSKEDVPSLLRKLSQEISDKEIKKQSKSSEADESPTKIEILDQRKNSSSSSSSDDENHVKNSTSRESKPKTSQMLSEIKFELNSRKDRKHSSRSSSEDGREKGDIETKVSNDMSQKTGFFSQMKVKILQSVDKSSSDEETISSEHKKGDLKTENKNLETDHIVPNKNVSSSSDSSSDEKEKHPKTHSPANSHSTNKITRIESFETTERKISRSSSDESIHIKYGASNDLTRVESHESLTKEEIHKFEKRLSDKLSSSSDEESVNHKSTIFISPQVRHETEISLVTKQNENPISTLNKSSSNKDDSSSSDDESEHNKQKTSSMFENIKNKFKKNAASSSSDDENEKCSLPISELFKVKSDNSNPIISSNNSVNEITCKATQDRTENLSDKENYIKDKPQEFPDNSKLIFSSSMLPKRNHSRSSSSSSSSSDEENKKKSLGKHDSNITSTNNDTLKQVVLNPVEQLKLEESSKFVLVDSINDSKDDNKNIFGNLKEKLDKSHERKSSSSDESETESKEIVKELPLTSNITSSINYHRVYRNETSTFSEIRHKEVTVRKSSSDDEKEITLEKRKEKNIQLSSFTHNVYPFKQNDADKDDSSSDEDNHHAKRCDKISSSPTSKDSNEIFHKDNMLVKLKTQIKSNIEDDSSSSDEENKLNNVMENVRTETVVTECKPNKANATEETDNSVPKKRASVSSTDDEKMPKSESNPSSNGAKRIGLIQTVKDYFNKSAKEESNSSSSEDEKINENDFKTNINKDLDLKETNMNTILQRSVSSSSDEDKNVLSDKNIFLAENVKSEKDISETNLSKKRTLYSQMKSFMSMKSEDSSSSDDETESTAVKECSDIDIIHKNHANIITKTECKKDDTPSLSPSKLKTSPDLSKRIKETFIKRDEDSSSHSEDDRNGNSPVEIYKDAPLHFEIRSSKDNNHHQNETSSDSEIKHPQRRNTKEKLPKNDEESSSSSDDDKEGRTTNVIKGSSFEFEIRASKDDKLHHKIETFSDSETKYKLSNQLHKSLSDSDSSSSDEEQAVTKPYTKKPDRESYVETIKHVFENLSSKSFVKAGDKIEEAVFDPEKCKHLDLINRMLRTINKYRLNHNAGQLLLNKQMCNLAMERARSFSCGTVGNLHSNFGENIFMNPSSGHSVKETTELAIEAWYKTTIFHKFEVEPDEFNLKSGSFTQLVWKSSKEIGIGIHESDREDRIFVVAIFSPAGNVKHQFTSQVTPRISSESNFPCPELGPAHNDRLI